MLKYDRHLLLCENCIRIYNCYLKFKFILEILKKIVSLHCCLYYVLFYLFVMITGTNDFGENKALSLIDGWIWILLNNYFKSCNY